MVICEKKDVKNIRIMFKEKEGRQSIVPLDVDIGTINYLHEDKYGNLYKIDALVDFKKGNIIKVNGKIVHYGPFLKRWPEHIFVVIITLVIGLFLKYILVIGDIFYYILGIMTVRILNEIYMRRVNKKYEKSHSIEIVKNK